MKVKINLKAEMITDLKYSEEIEVPQGITPDELDQLVDMRYRQVDGGDYTAYGDGDWVRGSCTYELPTEQEEDIKTEKYLVVHSTHGDIEIWDNGFIKDCPTCDCEECKTGFNLTQIYRFDLDEFCQYYNLTRYDLDDFDILDLGYWYTEDGEYKYEKPVESFRNSEEVTS